MRVKIIDLKNCLKHASKDENRPHLCGVMFDSGYMVSTDGHTLKCVKLDDDLLGEYIVPRQAIEIILKTCVQFKSYSREIDSGIVELDFYHDNVVFTLENVFHMKFTLVKREIPKWRATMPTEFKHDFILGFPFTFAQMKKKVLDKHSKVALKAYDGDVWLQYGETESDCYVVGAFDGEFEIGLNFKYIERAFENEDKVTFKFNNNESPVEINGNIVMPVRL